MAKGDIFEPIFEFVVRIFVPRYGISSIKDELTWSWLASATLTFITLEILRRYFKEAEIEHGEDAAKALKSRLRAVRFVLLLSLVLSLVMFRFGKGL